MGDFIFIAVVESWH